MADHDIEQARRWFAEELRFVARVNDPSVVAAFATTPRERFVGPGPLRVLSYWHLNDYWTPPDAGPAAVYHDVLIAYDEKRRLNNGLPTYGPLSSRKLESLAANVWSTWAVAWAITLPS